MFRIGQGIDFHRFSQSGREVRLGGIPIPFDRGIEAHSDGDLVIHALMDALLGAAGQEDIGCLFPDTDPRYANADSTKLLRLVLKKIMPYDIVNLDLTLLAEKPKISPYREAIRQNLSKILEIPVSRIGLKATTVEKMGSLGREEGLACWAVVLLQKDQEKEKLQKHLQEKKEIPDRIEIFTDGACLGNPGPGGWGVVINFGKEQEKTLAGKSSQTTNNRMELTAVIEALAYLETSGNKKASLYTDSAYVKNGIQSWIHGWKKNGWVNSKKEPVANRDLWETLDLLNQKLQVEFHWVKGHNGHPENERCDALAREQAAQASKESVSLF